MGAYMTCFMGGMAVAPLVGGVMIEHWWWGSVFLLGVPVMAVVLIAAPRVLPEYRATSAGRPDLPSAALSLSSILLIVGALKLAVGEGLSWRPVAAAAVGLALGAIFVRRQRTLADPLVMASGFLAFALVAQGAAGLAAMVCGSVLSTAGIGAVVPFLMNDVISRAPQERAGSAASLVQTANEIGIATGMVVLGSIGTVVYRSALTSSTGGATGSWVEGFGLAAAEQDPVLLGHVQDAFVSGFRAVGVFGVAVMAVVLVLRLGRGRR